MLEEVGDVVGLGVGEVGRLESGVEPLLVAEPGLGEAGCDMALLDAEITVHHVAVVAVPGAVERVRRQRAPGVGSPTVREVLAGVGSEAVQEPAGLHRLLLHVEDAVQLGEAPVVGVLPLVAAAVPVEELGRLQTTETAVALQQFRHRSRCGQGGRTEFGAAAVVDGRIVGREEVGTVRRQAPEGGRPGGRRGNGGSGVTGSGEERQR